MSDQSYREGKALARKTVRGGVTGYLYADGSGGYVIVNKYGQLAFLGKAGRLSSDKAAEEIIDKDLRQLVTKDALKHFGCEGTRSEGVVKSIPNAPNL